MIITISRYNKYFGSHGRKKPIHEFSIKLWKTYFSQKNEKIFVNMSQIYNSSLWIEKTCLRTCFKTLSFSRKNMRLKNIFKLNFFFGIPNQFMESPINEKSGVPDRAVESPSPQKTFTAPPRNKKCSCKISVDNAKRYPPFEHFFQNRRGVSFSNLIFSERFQVF